MKTISTPSQIINTARKLFSEYGYLGVSMQDIARRLKLTKPALYYHFSSKKEIYKKVIEEVFKELKNELQQALKKPPSQRGKEVIKTYLKFGLKDKNFIRILLFKLKTKDRQIKKYIFNLKKEIENLVINSLKKETKKPDLDFLIRMLDGIILEFFLSKKKINLNYTSKKISKIFKLG